MKTLMNLKNVVLGYGVILGIGLLFLTGCDVSSSGEETTVASADFTTTETSTMADGTSQCSVLIADLPVEPLSEVEKNDILFMREEEKLARDVYLVMYDKWGLMAFKNISKSEQAHMDAVKLLIDRYDLDDPAEGKEIGEFVNEDLQQLYNDLVKSGSESAIEALKVGALIEEVDIEDLRRILDTDVDNRDIALVYGNLLRGSGHHLKAYTWNLKRRGVNYTPQVLSQEAFDEIINS